MPGLSQASGLQLRSLITSGGDLELSLLEVETPAPQTGEVLVRVEAAPINPGDLGLLLGPADLSTLRSEGGCTRASVPQAALPSLAGRLDKSLQVGTEGAGVVIAAGPDAASQGLLGRTVAVFGGAMFAEHRLARTHEVMLLPEGISALQGAGGFANPLTALGMIDTLRREGHSALVHTAAASNLGRILNRVCLEDGVPLVNVVRSAFQAEALRYEGAVHVVDSCLPTFMSDLTSAISATGATLAFDAVGGGELADQILSAMEQAQAPGAGYSRYGSSVHKQVYTYGGLSPGPTVLSRSYGMAWSVGGWMLTAFFARAGQDRVAELRRRVCEGITTTFASHYDRRISLREALHPGVIRAYHRKGTGAKYVIVPQAA